MAANTTSDSNGLLGLLTNDLKRSPGSYLIGLGVILIAIVLRKLSFPSLDEREPRLLQPRIPVIGHLIGLLKYQNTYMKML